MPLTVITMTNCPLSLRGDLTKWMQEIATGVYVGNFNSRVREELWKRIEDSVGNGAVTMSFSSRNEIGYDFKTIHSHREVVYSDGLPLVRIPTVDTLENDIKHGFSDAAHFHNARKFSNVSHKSINTTSNKIENNLTTESISYLSYDNVSRTSDFAINNEKITCTDYWKDFIGKTSKNFVVIDCETTGLNSKVDKIIEIGAVKFIDGKIEEFQKLININCDSVSNFNKNNFIPNEIIELTGITSNMLESYGVRLDLALREFIDFVGKLPLLGYNVSFDIGFFNSALFSLDEKLSSAFSVNKVIDISRFVKKEKKFLKNYQLKTVLHEYNIAESVPHRALLDARLTAHLVFNLKGLLKFIS
ncbi:type I-E CRISPR-associated endoribonuclease Cas2e [Gardnerella vaginalis]|uniref:type I-E CRISPR-associated endoribonuclease Cas2e n=1 Tax=Gardnerella vaginalis TaxID=2702 RepID=UPI000353F676|nr:type I-E CRISPR-associated endoribonuclease Cas2e [Gardnerella vaginalis]EPI57186.1 CRISPR-associated endoribonuclease Cas2 [Gardnerella vaginalis JCP7275]